MYRVLIAEDEMLVRLLLKSSIDWSKYNMNVIADVSNGEAAWEVYKESAPDLVITDLKMPGMGGMELISKIRETDQQTKIVVLTCLEEFDLVRKSLALGVSDYILKLTMSPEEMEGVLQKIHAEWKHRAPGPNLPFGKWDKDGLKETILKDHLFRGRYTDEEFSRYVEEMRLRLTSQSLVLCVMEIDHFEEIQAKFKDKKGRLIRMSMHNVLDEMLGNCKRGEAFHDEVNRYILLFSFEDMNDEAKIKKTLESVLEYIKVTIHNYFNSSVSFGISRMESGYAQLSTMYEESIKALERKFFFGLGRFYYAGDFDRANLKAEIESKLLHFPKHWEGLGEMQQKELEAKIHHFIASEHQNKEQIYAVFVQWLHWPIMLHKLSGERISEMVLQFGPELHACETLGEMIGVYGQFLSQLAVLRKQNSLSREVVEAIQYLDRHYREDVTLQELAGAVKISPNYLSSLLKKETSLNFVDYLIHFRIEKAKELLLGTNMKAYEITERVGFTDQSYFSKTFKRIVGVRPSEFRKQWMVDRQEDLDDDHH